MEQYGFKGSLRSQMGREEYARRRAKRFGLTMVVLGISVGLYYLGFFGTAEGPLNPARIGSAYKSLGLGKTHLLSGLIGFFLVSLTWNWVYNIVNRIRKRLAVPGSLSLQSRSRDYDRTYRPMRKGVWGHTVWAALFIVLISVMIHLY